MVTSELLAHEELMGNRMRARARLQESHAEKLDCDAKKLSGTHTGTKKAQNNFRARTRARKKMGCGIKKVLLMCMN